MDRTIESLREVFKGYTDDQIATLADERRHEKYAPHINPERFDENLKRNGLDREESRIGMRAVVESWMAALDYEIYSGKFQAEHRAVAEAAVPRLQRIGALEGVHLEAGTGVSDIERFRSFLFGIVADVGPMLAPLADMIGIHPMPVPESKVAYLKTYGEETTTYYTSPFRLRDSVSTSFPEYTCGNRPSDIKFTVSMETITALAYAIISEINLCADQDARSQYGIDLDAEARKTIAYYIARTTVRRVLTTLKGAATGGSVSWTASGAGTEYVLDSFGPKNKQRQLFKYVADLVKAMTDSRPDLDNVWLWCSKDVVVRFKDGNEWQYHPNANGDGGYIQPAVRYAGNVGGSWRVIEDRDAPNGTLLAGQGSTNWSNTGAILGVYVPLMFVPNDRVFMDPADMQGKRAGVTRQGIKVVDAARFGLVTIA